MVYDFPHHLPSCAFANSRCCFGASCQLPARSELTGFLVIHKIVKLNKLLKIMQTVFCILIISNYLYVITWRVHHIISLGGGFVIFLQCVDERLPWLAEAESLFRVTGSCWFARIPGLIFPFSLSVAFLPHSLLLPWRWKQRVPQKHWYLWVSTKLLYGVISQNTVLLIHTAVTALNLNNSYLLGQSWYHFLNLR